MRDGRRREKRPRVVEERAIEGKSCVAEMCVENGRGERRGTTGCDLTVFER